VADSITVPDNGIKVCLLGASFDTGNLGVSALAESSIKLIRRRWPNARIILWGEGYHPARHTLPDTDKEIIVDVIPIRFSRNIFLPYHFLRFAFYSLLAQAALALRLKNFPYRNNSYFGQVYDAKIALDITGGDSFSDIYGFRRFFLGFLRKWLVIVQGKKFIMLPQTYGPFKRRITRSLARYILRRCDAIYCRDLSGIKSVNEIVANPDRQDKVKHCPDLAFVLDARPPQHIDLTRLVEQRRKNTTLIGLNISGLLYNGGYTQDNMFHLRCDYRRLICRLIETLLAKENVAVLLVPHVFPPPELMVESDPAAARLIYDQYQDKFQERIFAIDQPCDQAEIKYIIGLCDFFIGSRMHACIAALSQNIPTVGLAYSEKFQGVFTTADMQDYVIDMRLTSQEDIITRIMDAFANCAATARHLREGIPLVRRKVMAVLDDID